jgi:ubiquinone/menaquinone biosynthesis C-methylase UbiE
MSTDEAFRLHKAYASLRTFDERMTNRGFRRLWHERNDALAELLSRRLEKPLSECRILDFGCGPGVVTDWLSLHGASSERIIGVDLQRDRIAKARETYPDLTFLEANGEHLPFSAGQFDIVLALTVFSSILDHSMAKRIATEIMRVLAIGGVIIWYDMRYPNPFNPHLRAMTRSRIRSLFPTLNAELNTLTLLPPVAERLGPLTDALYPPLASIPALRSHYFGLLRSCR